MSKATAHEDGKTKTTERSKLRDLTVRPKPPLDRDQVQTHKDRKIDKNKTE